MSRLRPIFNVPSTCCQDNHGLHARIHQTSNRNTKSNHRNKTQNIQQIWSTLTSRREIPIVSVKMNTLRLGARTSGASHLNWGANVLGDEQQDQEDTGARAVHCGHQLEKDVLARPDSDLLVHGKDSRAGSTSNLRNGTEI